jgi:hypothetical protein
MAWCGTYPLQAQPPAPPSELVDETRLPLDKITPELLTDRIPVPWSEYQTLKQLAETVRQSPTPTRLLKADYRATYNGHRLSEGRFKWTLQNASGVARTCQLEPLGLAIRDLKWGDQPAIWGNSAAGLLEVLVDRPRGELQGSWELAGKTVGDHDEFVFEVPAASVSEITLHVPVGFTVTAGGQPVSAAPSSEGFSDWKVVLGGRGECRIVIRPAPPADAAVPLILTRHETVYGIRQEGLRFVTDVRLEVTNSAVRDVSIWADPDLEIYSISYGNELPLPWQTTSVDGRQRLLVQLPDPLLGVGRSLRLRGVAPLKTDSDWKLPNVSIAGAALEAGQVTLQLTPPLQLQDLSCAGYRQIGVETNAARDDVLTFKQFRTDGVLSVKLGKPQPRILARVLTDLQAQTAEWTCLTQLQLMGAEGAKFAVECRIPTGWEVIDVRDPQSAKLDWSINTSPDGHRLLSLQFLEALTPEKPRLIEIDARRGATSGDQMIPIPAFEPLAVDDLSMLVVVNSSALMQPILESGTSFEPCELGEIEPDWVNSKFWKTPLAGRTPVPLLLRLNGSAPEGHFSLQSLQTPIDVAAEVKIQASEDKLQKSVKLQITPRHGKTERVLVYQSESGPQLTWTLGGSAPRPIEARKLPVIRHAAWDLPSTGELWELRLPQPQSGPFELDGTRVRGLTSTGRLGLIFVPQAQAFRGRVTVQAPAELGLELTASKTDSESAPTPGKQTEQVWTWHLAQAALQYHALVAAEKAPSAVIRRAVLQARWTLTPGAYDYYVAQLELGSGFRGRELQIRLPVEAEVTEVRVDGQPIQVTASADGSLVLTNVTDEQIVTVDYRAHSPGLRRPIWRTILLPKLDIPVLRSDVELLTPSGFRLGSEPRGMALKSSTPSISTLQRLFGPLGRSAQDVFFNPWSPNTWIQSWHGNSDTTRASTAAEDDSEAPSEATTLLASASEPNNLESSDLPANLQYAGWKVWRGSAAMLPDRIDLWMWSNRQATGTAWLGFCSCLLLGTCLRLLNIFPRGVLGTIALTVEILLAFVLPPLPAQIVGGCLAGTLLAILFPQRLMYRSDHSVSAAPANVVQGSTRSYRPHGSEVAFGLFVTLAIGWSSSAAVAQVTVPTDSSNTSVLPQVLIPVDSNNRPAGPSPLAYVPEPVLKEWTALQSTQQSRTPWLIKSADYLLRRDSAQQTELTARYEVAVLAEAPEIELQFPLTGMNFGGPDACLVDGQPHPILTRPNSNLLLMRVAGVVPMGPSPPPMPETTEQSDSTATETRYPLTTKTYRVEFHGYPIVQSAADKEWMELSLPRLHSAKWTLQNDHPDRSWTNRIGETVYTVAPQKNWTIETGPVTKVRIEPVSESTATTIKPEMEARLALLANVEPAVAHLNYQVNYRVLQGQVSQVTWQIPRGLAIRDVTGPEVFGWHLVPSAGGTSQLRIDLQSPLAESFQIKVKALLPNDGPPTQLTIVPVQLLTPAQEPLRTTITLAGVHTGSEFQASLPADTGEQIASSTVEEFLNEWGHSTLDTQPQVAYSLFDPAPLKIVLKPLEAQRVVHMTAVGVLGSRRLQWNLNATIEVQTAAAYSHELELDPRLIITSVGIQEDSANRLLRWTRTGNVLHVFLRDKTTGTQTLTLQGTMPNQVPQELALPNVRFLNATIADAKLQLYQEPDLEVVVVDPEKWPRLEVPSELRIGAARNLLVGRFDWEQTAGPFILRAAQNEPVMNYSAVTSLQPRDDGRWKLTTTLLFEVLKGHGSQFSIRVPPELPLARVDAADVRQLLEREADGGQRIVLIPQAPIRGKFVVQVSGEVNFPNDSPAIIPEVLGLNATRLDHFVVLPTESALTVDPRTSGLTPQPVPAELAKLLPADVQGAIGHQYRGTAGSWTVGITRRRQDVPETGVLWTETRVWCEPTGHVAGRTSMLLGPQESEQIELTIPAGTELQDVLLDGEFIPHSSANPQRLLIPLTFPQSGHAITIYWTQPSTSFGMLYHRTGFQWPHVAGTKTTEQFATLTPPPGFRAHAPLVPTVERITVQLSELQTLLQLMQQRAAGGPAPQDTQWLFLHRQASNLIKRLQSESRLQGAKGALPDRFAKLRTQFQPWEQLALQTETTERQDSKHEALMRTSSILEGNLAGPHSLLLKLGPGSADRPLTVTIVGESVSRWTLGLALAAIVFGVLWLLFRWRFQEWLSNQPSATWAIFGVIWWSCLTPSWLGIIWLLIAIIYALRQISRSNWRAAVTDDEDFLPSPAV